MQNHAQRAILALGFAALLAILLFPPVGFPVRDANAMSTSGREFLLALSSALGGPREYVNIQQWGIELAAVTVLTAIGFLVTRRKLT